MNKKWLSWRCFYIFGISLFLHTTSMLRATLIVWLCRWITGLSLVEWIAPIGFVKTIAVWWKCVLVCSYTIMCVCEWVCPCGCLCFSILSDWSNKFIVRRTGTSLLDGSGNSNHATLLNDDSAFVESTAPIGMSAETDQSNDVVVQLNGTSSSGVLLTVRVDALPIEVRCLPIPSFKVVL